MTQMSGAGLPFRLEPGNVVRIALLALGGCLYGIPRVRSWFFDPVNDLTTLLAARALGFLHGDVSAAAGTLYVDGATIHVHAECSAALPVGLFILGSLLLPRVPVRRRLTVTGIGLAVVWLMNTSRVTVLAHLAAAGGTGFGVWHYYGFPLLLLTLIVSLWVVSVRPPVRAEAREV